jgi:hypothetical protein
MTNQLIREMYRVRYLNLNILYLTMIFAFLFWSFPAESMPPPASVHLVSDFDPSQFHAPNTIHWPGYLWLWNAELKEETIQRQLHDMASHGAKTVCMLPMPHAFRPDSTNNSLSPDYLTPEYFQKVRFAVQEAARLGMSWWIYDEGGWPSGQALGKVTAGHPELKQKRLTREIITTADSYPVPQDALGLVVNSTPPVFIQPGGTWIPENPDTPAYLYRISSGGYVDLLDPDTTDRFIQLTHEGYRSVLSDFIGKNVFFDAPAKS